MDSGLELRLLLRQQIDFDVRVGRPGHVHSRQVGRLDNVHRQLKTNENTLFIKGEGSPCSITERSVPELIPVLGCQPAGDVNHKPGGRLPLLSARPAVTSVTLKRAATNFAAW